MLDNPTSLRMTRSQRRKLDRLAGGLGMTRGALVRALVDALPASPPPDAKPKLLPWALHPLGERQTIETTHRTNR